MSKFIKILYALAGAAAAIGIISAIGSTCVSLDPYWQSAVFAIAGEYSEVWFVTYFVTWLAAIVWGVLFWALRARKAWFYPVAIINSILGCLSRGIPAILMSIGSFSKPRTGLLFTPSWAPALLNLAILIILLIPKFKQQILDHLENKSASSGGSIGEQVTEFASVLFGFGIVMLLQPFVMPSHVIDGVNIASSYGYLLASGLLQFYSGFSCIILGIITRIAGQFLNISSSSKSIPLEA